MEWCGCHQLLKDSARKRSAQARADESPEGQDAEFQRLGSRQPAPARARTQLPKLIERVSASAP